MCTLTRQSSFEKQWPESSLHTPGGIPDILGTPWDSCTFKCVRLSVSTGRLPAGVRVRAGIRLVPVVG